MSNGEIVRTLILTLGWGAVISVVFLVIYIMYKEIKTGNEIESENEIKTENEIESENKVFNKVFNPLIVKEKKKIKLVGAIYNRFGSTEVIKYILVVYDTYTNKYDEVPVTVDVYYSAEVGYEVMFDSEKFIHYE